MDLDLTFMKSFKLTIYYMIIYQVIQYIIIFYSFLFISNSNHKKYDNLHKKYNIKYIYLNTIHLSNYYNYYQIQIYNLE